MINTLTAIISIAVVFALEILPYRHRTAWKERGIEFALPATAGRALRFSFSVVVGITISFVYGLFPGVAAAAMAWLIVLAADTDIKSGFIPRIVCIWVSMTGLVTFVISGPDLAAGVSLLIAFGFYVLPYMIANRFSPVGFGMGDVRLIIAFVCTTTWWTGHQVFLFGLIFATVLQYVIRTVVRVKKGPAGVDDEGHKNKRPLPLAPALGIGMLLTVVLASLTNTTACSTLADFISCTQ